MSDLPSQRRYAPWVPIGQPGESTPIAYEEAKYSTFLWNGESNYSGRRHELLRNHRPSSFETFWVQRPKPPETHKATRFDVESFVSLDSGPGLFKGFGSLMYEDHNGNFNVTRYTLACAYDAAFPWSYWDWPEADAPVTVVQDDYRNSGWGARDEELVFLKRYDGVGMTLVDTFHDLFFHGVTAPQPAPVDFEQVDRLARGNIASKLAEGDVNISVFFAELPDGWRWLATMGTRLVNAILALMSGNIPKAISALRIKESRRQRRLRTSGKLASWDDFILEYNYAFRPLMSDLYGFLEAYIKGLQEEGNLIHVRTRVSDGGFIDNLIDYGDVGYRSRGREKMRAASAPPGLPPSVAVSYVVTYRVTDPYQRSLQELGLQNPFDVIWEKIPFSFLIDWLANFSSILSSATAEAGVEFVDGCKSTYSFSALEFSPEDKARIQNNVYEYLESLGLGPKNDGILEFRDSPVGYWFEVKRYPLDNFVINMNTTKLALTINPFKSDARLLNFLALINKAISR